MNTNTSHSFSLSQSCMHDLDITKKKGKYNHMMEQALGLSSLNMVTRRSSCGPAAVGPP